MWSHGNPVSQVAISTTIATEKFSLKSSAKTTYLWKHGETKIFCLHIGNKASKVQHENLFIYSYNVLHVSKQHWWSYKPLAGAELQVVFATGYRVNGTETNNLCWRHKYVSQATHYLTPQRHVPKPNLYTKRRWNRFLHIRKSPVT